MRMAEHSELHAFMGHENPSIVRYATGSGGGCATGDVCDPAAVAAFAPADVTVERVGQLLDYDLPVLLAAGADGREAS